MEHLKLVNDALKQFRPENDDEKAVVNALREIVQLQQFDPENGKVTGPRIDIRSVARKAELSSRNLISYEGCKLQRARELVLTVLGLLKECSLQIKCDFLQLENDHLQARLNKHDSIVANRVVALHRKKKTDEATSQEAWDTDDVLASVKFKSMSEVESRAQSRGKRTP